MSLDLSTIKKWVIPEGEVQSITVNGVVIWKKPTDTPTTQANHIKGTASAEFTAKLGDVTLTFPAGTFDVEYTGAQLTTLVSAFYKQAGLTSITSFGVDTSKVTCSQLSFKYCAKLTHDSIVTVINSLGTCKYSTSFILSDTQKAALSATEKAVLINKGWTLA